MSFAARLAKAKPMRAVVPLLLVLGASLASLLIGEGIVRLVAPQVILCVAWQDEVNGIMAPRASVQGRCTVRNTFDVRMSYNSQRFRGKTRFPLEPRRGVVRIVTLGDSFTYGWGAEDDESYPARLEQMLLRRQAEGLLQEPIEVINAGNAASGTGDQALWFETWVKQFRPHLLILGVNANDVDDDLARRLFVLGADGTASPRELQALREADGSLRSVRRILRNFPGYDFLAPHSHLLALLRNVGTAVFARKRRAAFGGTTDVQGEDAKKRFREEGLPMLAGEIRWLHRQAQRAGTRLVVVFLPPRERIYADPGAWADDVRWKSEQIAQILKEVCGEENIPFTDITPWLRRRAEPWREPLFYEKVDTHPNPQGYLAMAEAIATFLLEQRLLPVAAPVHISVCRSGPAGLPWPEDKHDAC